MDDILQMLEELEDNTPDFKESYNLLLKECKRRGLETPKYNCTVMDSDCVTWRISSGVHTCESPVVLNDESVKTKMRLAYMLHFVINAYYHRKGCDLKNK